jgi:capsid protein
MNKRKTTGYKSAKVARKYGFYSGPSIYDSQYNTQLDRETLISVSRDLYKDNCIYQGVINRLCNYITNGLSIQARTSDQSWNQKAESLFNQWFKNPEIRNLYDGKKLLNLVVREMFITGDSTLIMLSNGKLQLIESEQVRAKKINESILYNDNGTPTYYNVCSYKNGSLTYTNSKQYPADKIIFVCDMDRPSTSRGVPLLQASFSQFYRINDILEAITNSMQLQSRLAVSITRQGGPEQTLAESTLEDGASDDDTEELSNRISYMDDAIIFSGEVGDEIKSIAHDIPNNNINDVLRLFLRFIGLPCGIPLEVILLDWTQSNYSQSKAVIEQFLATLDSFQNLLINSFFNKIWKWKMEEFIKDGKLPKNSEYDKLEIIKPGYQYMLDIEKEANGTAVQVEKGFKSYTDSLKSYGKEYVDVINQRQAEIQKAIEISQEMETKYSIKVPWTLFCGLGRDEIKPVPEGVKTNE